MTMPTDRPRYYCPRYPTSHYDDSPDGYGPCAWCGTDGAHIAPPVECPSCGARVIDRDLKPETMPADPDVTTSAPRPTIASTLSTVGAPRPTRCSPAMATLVDAALARYLWASAGGHEPGEVKQSDDAIDALCGAIADLERATTPPAIPAALAARGRKRAEGAVVSPTVDLRLAFTTDRVRLYHGDHDLHDVTRVLAPESIDAIVTDPPSGIEFMGKSWDSDKGGRDHWIAWLAGIMRRAMVVLKPGGHALVWALPRTSHWTATAVEDAGFEIRDVVMHLFGSGFPKSLDVSKAIDFAGGESPADAGDSLRARREAAGMSVDDLAEAVGCSPVSIRNWEDGRPRKAGGAIERIVPSAEYRARLREVVGYSVDERAVVGSVVQRSGDGSVIGLGHTGTMRSGGMSRAAAEWSGWGTALKPAAEHWILARKPLSGTVAANVLAFGTGALNIDGCRIGMAGEVIRAPQSNPSNRVGAVGEVHTYARIDAEDMQRRQREATERTNALGRWPANVTLSHLPACGEACADGCAVAMLDAQSGVLTSGMMRAGTPRGPQGGVYEKGFTGRPMAADTFGDAGGASRFFYVAKPARSEKDAGLDHLPLRTGGEATDREEGSAGLNNPRAGAGRGGGVRNHHPTVKSIELMRWLCRLITPPGGTVLDLFAGSGTTGLAALREGFKFIGVERDPGFIDVAAGRLAHVECVAPPPVSDEASEVVSPVQPSLFGGA